MNTLESISQQGRRDCVELARKQREMDVWIDYRPSMVACARTYVGYMKETNLTVLSVQRPEPDDAPTNRTPTVHWFVTVPAGHRLRTYQAGLPSLACCWWQAG